MAEMPNIDPNFEPQSRPRSGTWPLNRPNIQPRKNRMQDMGGTFLDTTLEEANSQELIASESNMQLEPFMKDDYLSLLPPDSMSDIDCILMGSSPTANLVTDLSAISNTAIKPEPVCNPGTILSEYCSPSTMTELSNLPEGKTLEDVQSLQQQHQQTAMQIQNTANASVNFVSSSPSLSKSPPSTTVTTTPPAASTGATPKAKSTRKNAWGNMSYADLITQAIESSPEKRLTLAQIYEWMVKNVPYFKDKGDSNSSAGWKNSIRHNLSLHAKFKRIQNEGTGKSSWWVINHEAKPGKSPRRRAISMDNASTKYSRSRNKALAKQKAAEIMKKHKAGMKPGQRESGSWSRDPTTGLETPVSKALGSDYRQRASSNASSLGGRTSPSLFFAQDLDDDGAPPLSPLSGSISNLTSLPTSGGVGSIFDMVRQDPSTIPESLSTDRMVQDNLLESLASMDMTPDTKAGIYMQQMNGSQQNAKNNAIVQSTPELASLLSSPSPNKNLQKNTKQEQQWNDKGPYPYPDYQNQQQMIPQVQMQSPPQYKSPLQRGVNEDKPLYHFVPRIQRQNDLSYGQPNQVQQQQANYIQQQQRMQPCMTGQQMVQSDNQQPQPPPQYDSANIIQMGQANFPSDLANLENQQVFDSGDLDMNAVLSDIPSPDYASAYFGMEFESEGVNGGKPASFFSQMQDANDYNMGMNGNNMMDSSNTSGTSMQQQQPTMHPNPDVFITNTGPGSTSVDLMMRDGCRMNNANFQRMQATQQPPSVGASSYSMQ